MQLLALGSRTLPGDAERVMVEQAERLDHVGYRDAPVPDGDEILTVLEVGGRGEIVRTEIDARRRLVEVDHRELVMHARASAAGRLGLEGFRHVRGELRRIDRRYIAARVLHVQTTDLLVGETVDEAVLVVCDALY